MTAGLDSVSLPSYLAPSYLMLFYIFSRLVMNQDTAEQECLPDKLPEVTFLRVKYKQ